MPAKTVVFFRFYLKYAGGTTYGSLIKASRKVNLWEKQQPMKKQRKPISLEPLYSAAVPPYRLFSFFFFPSLLSSLRCIEARLSATEPPFS